MEDRMSENKEIAPMAENSHTSLIALAISQNADVAKIEKLLELQEKYEINQARKAYFKAMAQFKASPLMIEKDKTVTYNAGGKEVSYKHASLCNITQIISKKLSDFDLFASWKTSQVNNVTVTCRIAHSAGHFEETSLSAGADTTGSKNAIQAIGSTITYLERYTLLALTGLATDDQDDDGKKAEDNGIADKENDVLQDWLINTGTTEKQICTALKIESLNNLSKANYAKAISALKAKAEKASK
jgi:hypothetical protein